MELAESFEDYITLFIQDQLTEEQASQFSEMTEREEPQSKLNAFLFSNVDNFSTKLAQMMQDFAKSYLGVEA